MSTTTEQSGPAAPNVIASSAGPRWFTDEKIDEFTKNFPSLIVEALDRGDTETAKAWCVRNKASEGVIFNAYLNWMVDTASYAHDMWGERAAANLIKEASKDGPSELYKVQQKMLQDDGIRGHVRFVCGLSLAAPLRRVLLG